MLTVYSKETTSFSTLGIGALKDFTANPIITEELNGAYTLEFSYAKDGYLSEYLIEQNIVKANGQAFRIWNVKKDMNSITILAKHIFFDLSFNFLDDVYPKNLTAQGALSWLLNHAETPTNFTASGNCTSTSNARYVRKNIVDAIYNEDNALLNRFGGELSFNNFAITVNEKRGTDANFSIRYKKNLTGIDFNLDFSNVATRIIPIGFDGLTIDSLYVESPKVSSYFTPLYKTYEFGNIKYDPDDEEAYHTLAEAKQALINAANDLFNKGADVPSVSIKVNFVELAKCTEYENYSNLESVNLGDTIGVVIPELNINTTARVVKTVYDCILKRFTTLEIGSVTPSATTNQIEVNNQVKKTENYINEAQKNAESLINHPFKGNLYIDDTPGSGTIYFMDTTNPATAQSIWKWSIGGLGYSPNGINGTYTIGITQDGRINADFITTGHLDTSVIEGYDSLVLQVLSNTRNLDPKNELTSLNNTYHIEDAMQNGLIKLTMDGKSEQATRSGKNLLNNTLTTQTISGITLTKNNDGTFTINGTANAQIIISISNTQNIQDIVGLNKRVILSGITTPGNYELRWTESNIVYTDSGSGIEFLPSSNAIGTYIIIRSGASFNNVIVKPMIRLATITDPTYEPHGISPSPDYPSEIESVGYTNLWNEDWENGYYNRTTGAKGSGDTYIRCKDFIPTNDYRHIYFNKPTEFVNYAVIFYDKLKNKVGDTAPTNTESKEFLVPLDASYFTFYGDTQQSGATYQNDLIINKGSIPRKYVSNNKYGIEYKTISENLFSKEHILTGQIVSRLDGITVANASYGTSEYITVKPNTAYTFTNFNNWYHACYDENFTYLGFMGNANTMITLPNTRYIRISLLLTNLDTAHIEEGTTAKEYMDYKEQTYLITLDQPLRRIGNIKDKLRIENGMLFVDRNIRHAELAIADMNNSDNYPGWQRKPETEQMYKDYPNKNSGLSNYAQSISNIIDAAKTPSINTTNPGGIIFISKNYYNYTQTQWKSLYPNLVFILDYVMPSTETEELGSIDIPMLENINNIDIFSNINTDSAITYSKYGNLTKYIASSIKMTTDGIEAQVQDNSQGLNEANALLSAQGAKIEVVSKNIDEEGNVLVVRPTEGMKFDINGLEIYQSDNSFNTLINNERMQHRDGDNPITETSKDGFMTTVLKQKNQHYYGWNGSGYDFVDERVESDGDYPYAIYYNGTD